MNWNPLSWFSTNKNIRAQLDVLHESLFNEAQTRPTLSVSTAQQYAEARAESTKILNEINSLAENMAVKFSDKEVNKRRIAFIGNSMLDPFISLNSDGYIISINKAAEKLMDKKELAVVGLHIGDMLDRSVPNAHSCETIKAAFRHESSRYVDFAKRFTDGDPYKIYEAYTHQNNKAVLGNHTCKYTSSISSILDLELTISMLNPETVKREDIIYFITIYDMTEQKRMMELVVETAAKNRALVRSLPNPVFFKDENFKYVGCNAAFEQIVGKTEQDIIGKSDDQLFPIDDAKVYTEYDVKIRDSGSVLAYKHKMRNAVSGNYSDVLFSCSAIQTNEFSGIVGSLIDLSELMYTQKMQETLLSSIPSPIFITDTQNKIRQCNRAFEKFFLVDHSSVIDTDCSMMWTNAPQTALFKMMGSMKDYETSHSNLMSGSLRHVAYESTVYNVRDKCISDIMVYKSAVTDVAGKVTGILCLLIDRSEATLTQNFYNTLVNSLPNPIFYKSRDLKYTGCNQAYANLFGLEIDDIVGKTRDQLYEHLHEHLSPELKKYVEARIKAGQDYDTQLFSRDCDLQMFEGQTYDFTENRYKDMLHYRSVVVNRSGDVDGVVGILVDVSSIRDSQRTYETLVNALPNGIFQRGIDGSIIECNNAYCDILGVPVSRVKKKYVKNSEVFDLFDGDIYGLFAELKPIEENDDKSVYQGVLRNERRGTERQIVYYKCNIRDEQGVLNSTLGVVIDITELERLKKEAYEKEVDFDSLLYLTPELVRFMSGSDDVRISRAAKDFDQMLQVRERTEYRMQHDDIMKRSMNEHRTINDQITVQSFEGTHIHDIIALPVSTGRCISIAHDVSHLMSSVKQSKALASAINVVDQCILVYDENLNIMFFNTEFTKRYGYEVTDLFDTKIDAFFITENYAQFTLISNIPCNIRHMSGDISKVNVRILDRVNITPPPYFIVVIDNDNKSEFDTFIPI